MSDSLDILFDEFAARFARREDPDAREYVSRAGDQGPELAELLDAFLAAGPAPAPSPDGITMFAAWADGQPPVLELRVRRGRPVDAIVDVLVERLGLDPARRTKVRDHYQRLETGLLDPSRVDRRVLAVIAEALGIRLAELVTLRPPVPPAAAMLRTEADFVLEIEHGLTRDPAPPDQIDRLFGLTE